MRAAIIGYGLIGSQRSLVLANIDWIEEILIVDERPLSESKLPTKSRCTTLEEIRQNHFDLGIIAAPHDVTAPLAIQLSKNFKNLLIEKPMGKNFAEASQISEQCTLHKTQLNIGLNYRFLKNVDYLKKILSEKSLGRVLAARFVLAHGAHPGYHTTWKTDKMKCGGGVCLDPGVHIFDLCYYLLGSLQLTTGQLVTNYWPIEVEDHATLLGLAGDRTHCSFDLSISSWKSQFEICVEFEQAQIHLKGRGKYYGDQTVEIITKWPWLEPNKSRSETLNFGPEDRSLADETQAWAHQAYSGQTNEKLASIQDGLECMKWVAYCYQSIGNKNKVEFR